MARILNRALLEVARGLCPGHFVDMGFYITVGDIKRITALTDTATGSPM